MRFNLMTNKFTQALSSSWSLHPVSFHFEKYSQGRPLPMGQPGQSEQLAANKKKAKLCNIVTATSLLN
jgi:hypothetical protein